MNRKNIECPWSNHMEENTLRRPFGKYVLHQSENSEEVSNWEVGNFLILHF